MTRGFGHTRWLDQAGFGSQEVRRLCSVPTGGSATAALVAPVEVTVTGAVTVAPGREVTGAVVNGMMPEVAARELVEYWLMAATSCAHISA